MLIELSAATRKRLIQEQGYKLAVEWREGGKHIWSDDPPVEKNRLVLVPSNPRNAEEWSISSTRIVTISRELPGGPMGERYGIVCGEDDRGRSQFVLGGGKVQPDYNDQNADRLEGLGEISEAERAEMKKRWEFVRHAAVAENREELGVVFAPKDSDACRNYLLVGVRAITKPVTDPETGVRTTTVETEEKTGLPIGDACFITIMHERLGNFEGQRGETRARHVKPASELLRQLSGEERARGALGMLPYAHATALAMVITIAKEIFGKDMPPALAEVVADGEAFTPKILRNNRYAEHFTKVIQEGPWEV